VVANNHAEKDNTDASNPTCRENQHSTPLPQKDTKDDTVLGLAPWGIAKQSGKKEQKNKATAPLPVSERMKRHKRYSKRKTG